jgi:hypothetical protein
MKNYKMKLNNGKYNITPSDCKFIINKNNRTVVCIYEGSERTFIDFADHNFNVKTYCDSSFTSCQFSQLMDKLYMPNKFIGVATCSENDEWNEEIGKKVAFSRMKDKLNRSFFKRADLYVKTIDKWMDDAVYLINTVGQKLEVNQEKRHDLIKSYVGEDDEV